MEDKEAKKLKLNLFDGIVILLILLLAIVGVVVLRGGPGEVVADTKTVHYTLELAGLRQEMSDAVQVGDTMIQPSNDKLLGKVVGVEVQPYLMQTEDKSELIVREQEVSEYITLLVTIEVETTQTEKQIETLGGNALRVGTSLTVSNGELLGTGWIVEIDREDVQ